MLLASSIYITPQVIAARALARSLTTITLNRKLARRPSIKALVDSGILPSQCGRGTVAWGLVSVQRRIEKEVLKDRLRASLTRSWRQELERRNNRASTEQRVGARRLEKLTGTAHAG